MRSRAGRRTSAHDEALARRLALLGAELADRQRSSRAAHGDPTHTRVRVPTGAESEPEPSVVPQPGRHAATGRLGLGPVQLAVVALAVVAGLAALAWWLLGGRSSVVSVPVARPATAPVSLAPSSPPGGSGGPQPSGEEARTVTVDVAGGVRRPGIAVLRSGARMVDAVKAAGGARQGVDLTSLNLARVLVDGEQILVGVHPPSRMAAGVSGATAPAASLVNLNTADQVALESLPEV